MASKSCAWCTSGKREVRCWCAPPIKPAEASTKRFRALRRRVDQARNFPVNTCGASRHVAMIADALADGHQYAMLEEEPAHCAGSMFATVAALWEARTEIERLLALLPEEKTKRDAARDLMVKTAVAKMRKRDKANAA